MLDVCVKALFHCCMDHLTSKAVFHTVQKMNLFSGGESSLPRRKKASDVDSKGQSIRRFLPLSRQPSYKDKLSLDGIYFFVAELSHFDLWNDCWSLDKLWQLSHINVCVHHPRKAYSCLQMLKFGNTLTKNFLQIIWSCQKQFFLVFVNALFT